MEDTTFIAPDSGASSHMIYSKKYLVTNIQQVNVSVTAANKSNITCKENGDFRGYVLDSKCKNISICMKDVFYVPGLHVNLLSITKWITQPNAI